MALIGQAVSEEKIFENGGRRRRTTGYGRTPDHGHPISSPCEPYGSGELTKRSNIVYPHFTLYTSLHKSGIKWELCESKCAAQLQVNLNLRPIQGGISSKLSKSKMTFLPSSLKIFSLLPAS